jgi:hypothetical protein
MDPIAGCGTANGTNASRFLAEGRPELVIGGLVLIGKRPGEKALTPPRKSDHGALYDIDQYYRRLRLLISRAPRKS